MKFNFKAKDQKGKIREGQVEAIHREEAIRLLQRNGLVPIFVVREAISSDIMKEVKRIWEGIGSKELMIFFRELAILIEAKVPIVPAFRAIEEQTENRYLQMILREVGNDIEDGMPFSESLSRYPNTFSPLVVSMIRAGEVSGNLQKSVKYSADNIERNYVLTSRIRNALLYPAFVISVAFIVGFIAVSFILPKMIPIIEDLGGAIPWYTKVIVAIGNFMGVYWWAVLLIIFSFIGAFFYYVRTESGKKDWHHIQLSLPILGKLFRYIFISRFAENFAVLLAGGIPLVRALGVVSEVVNNSVFQGVILKSADEVKSGGNISTVLSKSDVIPPIVAQMVRIGEETGKIGEILKNISRFYEQEVENMSRNLSTLIEPILIVILGISVSILVFAILLPIYNAVDNIA